MRCPVCRSECTDKPTCPECGFSEVGKTFINQADAQSWMENVVVPYKVAYIQSSELPPLDWFEVFKKNPRVKALFEISIPVAMRKQEQYSLIEAFNEGGTVIDGQRKAAIDAALAHIAYVSTGDKTIDAAFVDAIWKAMKNTEAVRHIVVNKFLTPGDFLSALTNLITHQMVVFELVDNAKTEIKELLEHALSDYAAPMTLGKGNSARRINLELPVFTGVVIINRHEDIPDELEECFGSVVDLALSNKEMQEYQIRNMAEQHGVRLTQATFEVLIELLPTMGIKQTIRYISDYLYLHNELQQPLSKQELIEILDRIR